MGAELNRLFGQINAFKAQPIEGWHPVQSVDIDIAIDAAGQWYYQNSPIARQRIVKLFATLLRFEEGDYFLITPPVKYRIQVADAPFLAVELRVEGGGDGGESGGGEGEQKLFFRTNMDNIICADHHHPISLKFNQATQQHLPYVKIRDGLMAKMTRAVYYELVELAEARAGEVQSGGERDDGGRDGDNKIQYVVMSAGNAFSLGSFSLGHLRSKI